VAVRKIVLATVGSLGDLHPFIAIGLALQRRGFRAVLAVPEDHVPKCRNAGLEAVAILPSFASIARRLGLSDDEAVRRFMHDQAYLLEHLLLPSVVPSAEALDGVIADSAALIGSLFVFAAPIVAEKHGMPLVSVVLQPMTLFSAYDPPRAPDFRLLRGAPAGWMGLRWNRAIYRVMRAVLRRRYAAPIDAARAAHGLPPSPNALMMDFARPSALTVCAYSAVFGPLQPDAPSNCVVTGFPVFDSCDGNIEPLDPALEAFLAAGPPPIVFTLGSFAVYAPGGFYGAAVSAARALGMRAVMLVGDRAAIHTTPDIHVTAYAPHSALFPRAAAIVHHGGVGTTGQALRAGKPQLVVPHMGDQSDNGRRIVRMGVGRMIAAKRFDSARAARAIEAVLADTRMHAEAARIGALIAAENGGEAAADAIDRMLVRRR
jgi:rhamnosyltransferase subunit B